MTQSQNAWFPPDFLDAMRLALPDPHSLETFIAYCQRPLRRSLRVNTLKISVEDFLSLTAPYAWQLTPIPWCAEGFWIEREDEEILPLGSTAEHLSGLFYIQEASSMLPVSALFYGEEKLQYVMDLAAAPGSKTTQMAALMNNKGIIIANEYSASRVKVLHANISRCGIRNVALTHFDGRVFGAALPECFDAILLDAPCSGEGVIRKDPNALRNWSTESTKQIAETQRELINSAFHALRPGGKLVYSTCTLNREENQKVCQYLLDNWPGAIEVIPLNTLFPGSEQAVTAEGYLHVFPQLFDCEGFFVACFRKKMPVTRLPVPGYKTGKFPFKPLSGGEAENITRAASQVGIHWDDSLVLWRRDKEIWLFPALITSLIGQVRFSRIGLKLAEQHNKGYRWQHEAVIALSRSCSPMAFPLTEQQADDWYHGRDISPEVTPSLKEVIVTWQNQPLGLAKKVGSRLKNSYPRELVRDGKLFYTEDCTKK